MARTESDLKVVKFTNDLLPEHWNWTEEEKKALLNRDLKKIGEYIAKRLSDAGHDLIEFYLILHDRDSSYIHLTGLGKVAVKLRRTKISEFTGIPLTQVETLQRGSDKYDGALAYLTHMKETTKVRYSPKDVVTVVGRDYMEIFEERKEAWLKGREKKRNRKSVYDRVKSGIIHGTITREYMIENYLEDYTENYRKYDRLFENKREIDIYVDNARKRAAMGYSMD